MRPRVTLTNREQHQLCYRSVRVSPNKSVTGACKSCTCSHSNTSESINCELITINVKAEKGGHALDGNMSLCVCAIYMYYVPVEATDAQGDWHRKQMQAGAGLRVELLMPFHQR